jgi:UDP-N-acetylglucosamine--N-acetylmuramyl-(pentapeptide) pyrophosphoryl-undecaprenol N-acetylglucosamine transferase
VKVLIAGGGTGGHVYPGIAIAEELRRMHPDAQVLFVGGRRGVEAAAVPESGFPIRFVTVRGLPRRAWWRWPGAILANAIGFIQSVWVVSTERPDVVVGTGGYVSGPVAFAAFLMGRPLLLQEQNSIPGLANRWLARVAREVHLSFTEARGYFARKDNLKVTGNPVRAFILEGDRGSGMQEFGLTEGKPTVFIFGGSRGAHRINEASLDAMRRLKGRVDVQFILQTGRDDYEWAKQIADSESLPTRILPYLRQIHLAYAVADLVVCRSGAMTLAEIAACGTPAILVPYPYAAHNHQEVNALNLVERGAAAMVLDRELTGERLAREIAHLLADRQTLRRMSANARTFARLDAAERLVRSIEQAATPAHARPNDEEAEVGH